MTPIILHYIKRRVVVGSPWECIHRHVVQRQGIVLQVFLLFLSYAHCCRVAGTRLWTRSAGQAHGRGPAVDLATLRSFNFLRLCLDSSATTHPPLCLKLFSILHAITSKADAYQVWRPNTVPPQVENESYETSEYNRHHFCIAKPYTTVIPLSSH